MCLRHLLLSLLFSFFILESTLASDPDPVQDYCIPNTNIDLSTRTSFEPCKNPKFITPDDFVFTSLNSHKNFSDIGLSFLRHLHNSPLPSRRTTHGALPFSGSSAGMLGEFTRRYDQRMLTLRDKEPGEALRTKGSELRVKDYLGHCGEYELVKFRGALGEARNTVGLTFDTSKGSC